ncbi:hypothetical protein XENOCAPTIV_003939, partial [Xenoophorus captivus]
LIGSQVSFRAWISSSAFLQSHERRQELKNMMVKSFLISKQELMVPHFVLSDSFELLVSSVILSITSKTMSAKSRLGDPVTLDCSFWVDPSNPLSASGFAVEWRYQTRGDGRLVLAYDGKMDRLADTHEQGVSLDFEALHERGNASLLLEEAKVRHSGTYICTVYLPYLLAQVTMDLQIIGFAPLPLELSWEFKGADGKSRSLGSGSVSGHRQAWDGTYSQSTRLELDTSKLDLGRGGEVTCVAVHAGGTRRANVTLNVIGNLEKRLLNDLIR